MAAAFSLFADTPWVLAGDGADSGAPAGADQRVEPAAAKAPPGKSAPAPQRLEVGDPAPALDIDHWVTDGDGAIQPFKEFEDGQVYVVEVWTTWCPDCIKGMPHLSTLQQKYAGRGVKIVGVSEEPLEVVTKFLARKATDETNNAGEPITWADVTKPYALAADPDQSVRNSYMVASGLTAYPSAWIVGKDGRIEWMGDPKKLDEPLERVVADSWDREAFKEAKRLVERFEADREAMYRGLSRELRGGSVAAARKVFDAFVAAAPNDEVRRLAEAERLEVEYILFVHLLQNDQPAAEAQVAKLLELSNQDANMAFQVGRVVARHGELGNTLEPGLLGAAAGVVAEAIERVGDANPVPPALRYTQARLVYLKGDADRAIATAEKALKTAGGRLKLAVQKFVARLRAERDDAGVESVGAEAAESRGGD